MSSGRFSGISEKFDSRFHIFDSIHVPGIYCASEYTGTIHPEIFERSDSGSGEVKLTFP